jgi:hypothetical protein
MTLTLAPTQELLQEGHYGESVLPEVAALLDDSDYDEVLRTLKNADVEEYRCKTDWFLCLVLPGVKPQCLKYYEDGEERLCDRYNAYQLRKMDAMLVAQLELFRSVMELQGALSETAASR